MESLRSRCAFIAVGLTTLWAGIACSRAELGRPQSSLAPPEAAESRVLPADLQVVGDPSPSDAVAIDRERARQVLFRILMESYNGGRFTRLRKAEYDELVKSLGEREVEALTKSFHQAQRETPEGKTIITFGDHELRLYASGAINCWIDPLVPPPPERMPSAIDTLDLHLNQLSYAFPVGSEVRKTTPAEVALRIEAEPDTQGALLLVVLKRCARERIRDFDLAIGDAEALRIETLTAPSAPPDSEVLTISVRPAGTAASEADRRQVSYAFRPIDLALPDRAPVIEASDLEALEVALRQHAPAVTQFSPLYVEPSPKTLCSELAPALALVRATGRERIVVVLVGD